MELTKKAEAEKTEPLIVQYFQGVDDFIKEILPKDKANFYIELFSPGMFSPTVIISRIQTSDINGQTTKQDEIELSGNKDKLHYSAKCDADGNYIEYSENLSKKEIGYIKGTLHRFRELVNTAGSSVLINGDAWLVSSGIAWVFTEKDTTTQKSQFTETTKLLPE